MYGLEIFLWAGDGLCFVLLVVVEIRKFCVTVWNGRGGSSVSPGKIKATAWVKIDSDFIRQQARDAVQQFFLPITAPFKASEGKASEPSSSPPSQRKAS